jgi:hypothetical protein
LKENLKIHKKMNLMNKFWILVDKNYFPPMKEMPTRHQIQNKLNSFKAEREEGHSFVKDLETNIQRKCGFRGNVPTSFSNLTVAPVSKEQAQLKPPVQPKMIFKSLRGFGSSMHSRGILNCRSTT